MSTLKTNNVQIGQSNTATNNFVVSVPVTPDGTMKIARGNVGSTTQDIISIDSSGDVTIGTNGKAVGTTGTQTLSNKTLSSPVLNTPVVSNPVITGTKETRVAIAASNIDLSLANYFTKTISGATTFTVSNIPTTDTAISFILDLTNGGSAAITWWAGVKWAGGTAPTLTASGRDVLGFFTYDGGATWTGLVLGKDVK